MDEARRAIQFGNIAEMRWHLPIYRAGAVFTGYTYANNCRCSAQALGLTIETCGVGSPEIVEVLVTEAGVNPNAPYEFDDLTLGVRMRTNALTHLFARWNLDNNATELWYLGMLVSLLNAGADANAPPLFEVTDLHSVNAGIPAHDQRIETLMRLDTKRHAAWSERLLLYVMSPRYMDAMRLPPSFQVIRALIEFGHAHFTEHDPDGLLASYVDNSKSHSRFNMNQIMAYLVEMAEAQPHLGDVRDQDWRALCRIVRGVDPDTGRNLMHIWVEFLCSVPPHSVKDVAHGLRIFRDVYRISPLASRIRHANDRRNITEIAAMGDTHSNALVRQAISTVIEEERTQQTHAMATAQVLYRLPTTAVVDIGKRAGFSMMEDALRLDSRLVSDDERRIKRLARAMREQTPAGASFME